MNPIQNLMNWLDNYYSANEQTEIKKLQNEKSSLEYKLFNAEKQVTDDTILIKKLLAINTDLETQLENAGGGLKDKNILPPPFVEATNVYKHGFWLKTSQGDSYLAPKDAGGHLTLTSFLYHIIDTSGLSGNETALEAFNKILGAQQGYTTYIFDQDQWGSNHAENWTPAVCVLNTKKDDCESLASLAVSAFEFYRIIENKFPEAYAFVGTGLYSKQFGHGFPCLYLNNGKPLEESLFIGESTLHSKVGVKPLKDCKNTYWCNWGNNSFWHDFRLKPEFYWWDSTATTQRPTSTGFGPEGEAKKKAIEKFWKVK